MKKIKQEIEDEMTPFHIQGLDRGIDIEFEMKDIRIVSDKDKRKRISIRNTIRRIEVKIDNMKISIIKIDRTRRKR